ELKQTNILEIDKDLLDIKNKILKAHQENKEFKSDLKMDLIGSFLLGSIIFDNKLGVDIAVYTEK
ncbi:hypothetical protein MHBO_003943, partial [Bonamia ostreae]